MPPDEPAYRFVINESRIKSSLRTGAPRTTYLDADDNENKKSLLIYFLENKRVGVTLVGNSEKLLSFFEWSHVYIISLFYKLFEKESNIL